MVATKVVPRLALLLLPRALQALAVKARAMRRVRLRAVAARRRVVAERTKAAAARQLVVVLVLVPGNTARVTLLVRVRVQGMVLPWQVDVAGRARRRTVCWTTSARVSLWWLQSKVC